MPDRDGPMFGTQTDDELAEIVHLAMCENLPYRDRCRLVVKRLREWSEQTAKETPFEERTIEPGFGIVAQTVQGSPLYVRCVAPLEASRE